MRKFLISGAAFLCLVNTGCLHSYYTCSVAFREEEPKREGIASDSFAGCITIDYERFGYFEKGCSPMRMDPQRPILSLISFPFWLVVESPWHWRSKCRIDFRIANNTKCGCAGASSKEFPWTRLRAGSWRDIAYLRMGGSDAEFAEVILSECKSAVDSKTGKSLWRYKLRVLGADSEREYEIKEFSVYSESQMGFSKKLMALDGNTILLLNGYLESAYVNHFWRKEQDAVSVALLKFDVATGESQKMIWFDRGSVETSNDVQLDADSKLSSCGWLWCDEDF